MFNKKTISFSAISMALAASSSFATMDSDQLSINQLPKSGYVTLYGTVDDIDNNQEFLLRDMNGDTIDVDLSSKASLHEGDRVKVGGTLSDDFLGFGHEINAASVVIIDEADQSVRANAKTKKPISLGNIKEEVSSTYRAVKEETKQAFSMGDNSKGAIEMLPNEGVVSIKGEVKNIDKMDRSFTLKDNMGETIDVHSPNNLTISDGDQVIVKGEIKSAVAGLGEEIIANSIVVAKKH